MLEKTGHTFYAVICAVLIIPLMGCVMDPVRRGQKVSRADTEYNFNLNIGSTPAQIVFDEPPVFIAPPRLGFYTAVGIPYDMFLVDSKYYLYRNGTWYMAYGYNGPWRQVRYSRLPWKLKHHKYEQIIRIRDEEYRNYEQDRDHYRGKKYRPKKHKNKGHGYK